MRFKAHTLILLISILSLSSAFSQTKVDLSRNTKNVDFTSAPFTRPIQTGTSLPATCTVGGFYFQLITNSSGKLWTCYATNTWQEQTMPPAATGLNGSVLTNNGTAAQWVTLGGDVSGAPQALSVTGLQGRPVAATAPLPGQILSWNGTSWTPGFANNPSSQITVTSGSTVVNNASTLNLTAGPGILLGLIGSGNGTQIQHTLDTAVVETRTRLQSGAALYCPSASADPVNYTCTPTPAITALTTGMVLHWRPDVAGTGGATTIKLSALTAVALKLADGTSDPTLADIEAGKMYPIWYDGTQFRMFSQVNYIYRSDLERPACDVTLRGRFWHKPGVLAAVGPPVVVGTKDSVAVCAKDDMDAYDWRTIY